ncbi:hydrolase 1, exosortase A system-associated [Massilia genomosp. 1]|uniref:hydrolase 1, exosortase A system-associated n=1 Tax=Massilia genomosp. 1 TaxID=2609280 RepID=UPI001E34208D|nr:hydrolase 1, exosortase A system-associated [Massilia genomosp. 1]
MTAHPKPPGAEPFFLQTGLGQRFCLFHPPAGARCRGAVLYVHPFGDEMNKARRMAAVQARALAAQGYGVLQLDLAGCGDSGGEFAEARWDTWKGDLAAGCAWLSARLDAPLTLWGLRLGALLALDYAHEARHPIARLVLWQPVQNGATFLTQFLRLLTANAMLAEGDASKPAAKSGGTAALRATLLGGEMLEVAGYEIAPALAAAIDSRDAGKLAPLGCPVHWLETSASAERPLTPAVTRLADAWREAGVDLHLQQVTCTPFWSTQEIAESPELLAATSALFDAAPPAGQPVYAATHGTPPAPPAPVIPGPPACREDVLGFSCGGEALFGILSVPAQPAKRAVLIVVGGPQYRVGSHRQFTTLARGLAAQGIAALRFDYRGMGDSHGAMRDFEAVGEDLRAAVDSLFTALPGVQEVVIWGLCDGASAAIFYAADDARVSGLVLLNPWVRTSGGHAKATIKHYYRARLFDPELWKKILRGQLNVGAAAASFLRIAGAAAGKGKGKDQAGAAPAALPERMRAGLARFRGKVLLIISGADLTAQEFLDTAAGSEQWQAVLAAPQVSRQTLVEADHTFSRRVWKDQVLHWTGDWLRSW